MHSQMVRPHEHDAGHHAGELGEDEHHHEKKSVLKKVKAKAKKIKDTLKLQGHGHQDQDHLLHDAPDDHDLDQEDDEDEEMVEDPEIHGTSGLHSMLVRNSVPEEVRNLGDARNYYGSTAAAMEDQEPPHSEGTRFLKSFLPKQEEDEGNKVLERTGHIKEEPYTPQSLPAFVNPPIAEQLEAVNPIESFSREQEAVRGQPEIGMEKAARFEEDPGAPKNRPQHHIPTNYETKVNDPTGEGTKEIEGSSILHKLEQMGISETDESKPEAGELHSRPHDESIFPTGSHDQFSPGATPPMHIMSEEEVLPSVSASEKSDASEFEDQPSEEGARQSSYTEKISSATSAIANKAISAKNVVRLKLGYGEKQEEYGIHGEQEKSKEASPVEYGKKIASTVTEKLTPVYDKVAETGSNLMSKAHATYGREEATKMEGQDKGVSMRSYFSEKLKPGEEDRALSEVISEALHKQKDGTEKTEKKMGKVTESEEVRRRLGSAEDNSAERVDAAAAGNTAGSVVVSKLKEVVGSFFGKGEETRSSSQQSLGSSNGSEGFPASLNEEETREKRLQESGN